MTENGPGTTDTLLRKRSYPAFRDSLASSGCDRCGLSEARTSIVVDRGNYRAPVMVIGEGPGAEEDRQGRAFVGRSGKLLDQMLAEAGLDADEDVLIANIVKCRPPKNRAPKKTESETCSVFLQRQIELVKPKVLVLLGATAVGFFLPERMKRLGLTSMVGEFSKHPELSEIDLFPVFHPAYILRNPSKRGIMVGFFKQLRARLLYSRSRL